MITVIVLTVALVIGLCILSFLGVAWMAHRETKRIMTVFDQDRAR